MVDTQQIELSISDEQSEEAMQCLLEAVGDISKNAEKDFTLMQKKKWYKRLWELVTFSRNNEKLLAHGVTNCAKLEEIIMRALTLLSLKMKDNAENMNQITSAVSNLNNCVGNIIDNQACIVSEIEKLKYGFDKELHINDVPGNKRYIIVRFLAKCCNQMSSKLSEEAHKMVFSIYNAAGIMTPDANIEDSQIENLSTDEQKLFFRLIMSVLYLSVGNFEMNFDCLDHLGLSPIKKKEITNSTKDSISAQGKENFVNWFTASTDLSAAKLLSDNEIDFYTDENNPLTSAETAEVVHTMQEWTNDSILEIAPEDTLSLSYCDIHLRSYIQCQGKIQLANCIVHYNETDRPDEITLESNGLLSMQNCKIVCHNFDDHFFIQAKDNTSLNFQNCVFEDCSNFVSGDEISSLQISKCQLNNCYIGFAKTKSTSNGFCKIADSIISSTRIRDFNQLASKGSFSSIFNLRMKSCIIENCIIEAHTEKFSYPNIFDEELKKALEELEECEKKLDYLHAHSNTDIFYFSLDDNAELTNCTFTDVSNCLWGGHRINKCEFLKCCNVIHDSLFSDTTIENCLFDSCEDILSLPDCDSKVTNSKFINCRNNIINAGNLQINFCEFENIKTSSSHKHSTKEDLIRLEVGKYKQANIISKCIFNNIQLDENFLIAAHGSEKIKDDLSIVKDCTFMNCTTNRKSGKMIKQYIQYDTLFKKNIDCKVIDISSCRGLDGEKYVSGPVDGNSPKGSGAMTSADIIGSSVLKLGLLFGPIGIGVAAASTTIDITKQIINGQKHESEVDE